MVKRSVDHKIRARNFEARNQRIETGAVVKDRRHKRGVARGLGECDQWKAKGDCSKGDNCSFCHKGLNIGKWRPKTAPSSAPRDEKMGNSSRKKGPRGRSPSGKSTREMCQGYMHGECTKPWCDFWHPPECQHYKKPSGCRFGDKCVFMHKVADGQPSKKPKKQLY